MVVSGCWRLGVPKTTMQFAHNIIYFFFFPLWKGCSMSAGNKADCCSIASTADQAFLPVLKGK